MQLREAFSLQPSCGQVMRALDHAREHPTASLGSRWMVWPNFSSSKTQMRTQVRLPHPSRYPNSNSRVDRHMHTRVSGVFQETPTSPSAGLLGKPLQVIAGTIYLCSARVELGTRVRVECVPVTTLRWKALDSQEWALQWWLVDDAIQPNLDP